LGRHRSVSDADWNQLITLASGYLALESGDIQAAMQRALAAHMDLISALKAEQISAEVEEGRVTMFVPEGGGVALRMEAAAMDIPLTNPDADEVTLIRPQPDADPMAASLSDAPTASGHDPNQTFRLDEDD
jgi:hypothetical protein